MSHVPKATAQEWLSQHWAWLEAAVGCQSESAAEAEVLQVQQAYFEYGPLVIFSQALGNYSTYKSVGVQPKAF